MRRRDREVGKDLVFDIGVGDRISHRRRFVRVRGGRADVEDIAVIDGFDDDRLGQGGNRVVANFFLCRRG